MKVNYFFIFPDWSNPNVSLTLGQPPVGMLPAGLSPRHLPPRPHLHHHRLRAEPEGRDQGHEEGAGQYLHAGSVRGVRQD